MTLSARNSNEELIEIAMADPMRFKEVGLNLESGAPDAASAAHRLVTAYQTSEVPAWETAFLLGRLGDDSGYETVRSILWLAPGNLAESYAGVAMVQIRRELAFDDLRIAIIDAPARASREGAAYGLSALTSLSARDVLIQAATTRRIRFQTAASLLARMRIDPQFVVTLLCSTELHSLRLGTEMVLVALRRTGSEDLMTWYEEHRTEFVRLIRAALAHPELTTRKDKLQALTEWVSRQDPK